MTNESIGHLSTYLALITWYLTRIPRGKYRDILKSALVNDRKACILIADTPLSTIYRGRFLTHGSPGHVKD